MESDPTDLISPPATRLAPIPDALHALGDEPALGAWWNAMCTGATREQIAGRAEAMARLIELDPEAARADMQAYLTGAGPVTEDEDTRLAPKLEDLVIYLHAAQLTARHRDDGFKFRVAAERAARVLRLLEESEVERLGLAADLDREPAESLDTKLYTHLSVQLIVDQAHASPEGMDLLGPRITQFAQACVAAALAGRAA